MTASRRTAVLVAFRAAVVLLLGAALADLPLPARSRARVRLHLVDRSDSVRVPGPPESLTLQNADQIIAWDRDRRAAGDTVFCASFGADIVFESDAVDPRRTDLNGAIRAALARNPTEIILYSDGRADPGDALLLCRARGVPIHVFPLGPLHVRDARIRRIRAPADAPAGMEVPVEVTVEATFTGTVRLHLDGQSRTIDLSAGIPAAVAFPVRAPATFEIRLEPEDACPRNNRVTGEILARTEKRRALVLAAAPLELPGWETVHAPRFGPLESFDAVILYDVTPSLEEMRALAAYVRDWGGGLVLMGGKRSYALGGWKGTPLDEISPLRAVPDDRVAAVFAVDSSGSMSQDGKLETVLEAVRSALPFFEKEDHVALLSFSDRVEFIDPGQSFRVRAGGGTYVARGMREALRYLLPLRADRKHVFLMTDGEVAPQEKPEERLEAAERLREAGIGLTVLTTHRPLEVGTPVPVRDWASLREELVKLLHAFRGDYRENPGPLHPRSHPVMAGVPPAAVPWINRTSLREGAQLAAVVGTPPTVDPAAAFLETGRGRVAAFAFPPASEFVRIYLQALEFVSPAGAEGLTLSLDYPTVRARGTGPPEIPVFWRSSPSGDTGKLALKQVGPDLWEGTLPLLPPGTVHVRAGRARTSGLLPCSPEDEALGVDRAALERIARETGGQVLSSSADLESLPRPSLPGRRRGRPFWLAAAAALFLAELALSIFWKP